MKAARYVLEYLKNSGVEYIFGIPAGSVNVIFDELYEMPEITPIITKHEGAASYMAAAYAKYANRLSVCIGCSGPGGTNLVTGAANAMREHLPVLFITGAVPMNTVGLNASQELDAAPIFAPVTKYSVRVNESKDVLAEVAKAVEIAVSGVPGPVHVALPIDVQAGQVEHAVLPAPAVRKPMVPDAALIRRVAEELVNRKNGIIMAGQGIRGSVDQLVELAEMLNWPIITTPVAKGYLTEDHPLNAGIFGFAGHESASNLINTEVPNQALLVIGSSLGETATNNYNGNLNKGRFTIQMDFDQTVFNRKYPVDIPVLGDIHLSLLFLIDELRALGLTKKENGELRKVEKPEPHILTDEYNTKNVFTALQNSLPTNTRYTVDIGEFMSYVIHYMHVVDNHSFDINVHFGAMGSGISSAIGAKLADPDRPVVSLTGDGCFFMHGMEVLTAKEYNLPILFVVMNNARLGMVYHGHNLQYKRTHATFDQQETNIAAMAAAMGLPSFRVGNLEDLNDDFLKSFTDLKGPAVLEIALKDNSTPPMGDRVKFLSSFGK